MHTGAVRYLDIGGKITSEKTIIAKENKPTRNTLRKKKKKEKKKYYLHERKTSGGPAVLLNANEVTPVKRTYTRGIFERRDLETSHVANRQGGKDAFHKPAARHETRLMPREDHGQRVCLMAKTPTSRRNPKENRKRHPHHRLPGGFRVWC